MALGKQTKKVIILFLWRCVKVRVKDHCFERGLAHLSGPPFTLPVLEVENSSREDKSVAEVTEV